MQVASRVWIARLPRNKNSVVPALIFGAGKENETPHVPLPKTPVFQSNVYLKDALFFLSSKNLSDHPLNPLFRRFLRFSSGPVFSLFAGV
jgi:hypothetical protein